MTFIPADLVCLFVCILDLSIIGGHEFNFVVLLLLKKKIYIHFSVELILTEKVDLA